MAKNQLHTGSSSDDNIRKRPTNISANDTSQINSVDGPSQSKKSCIEEASTDSKNEKCYPFEKSWNIPRNVFKIHDFRSLGSELYNVDGCPDLKYYIYIFYHPEHADKNFSIGLSLQFPHNKYVQANYIITTPTARFSKRVIYKKLILNSFYYDVINDVGSNPLMKDDAFEVIVKGTITLIEKDTLSPVDIITLDDHNDDIVYTKKNDLKFVVNGRKISVHKAIIHQKFTNLGNTVSNIETCYEIQIKDFLFDVVNAAVAFCYDNNHPLQDLSNEDLFELIKFGDLYGVENLKDKTESILGDKLNYESCIDIANATIRLNAQKLKQKCLDFILKAKRDKNTDINFKSLDASLKAELFDMEFQ